MVLNKLLSVREIQKEDIPLVADYWVDSDPDYMVSLGVDLNKLPSRVDVERMLNSQINTPFENKQSYALIWLLDNSPIGHCNVNNIEFGKQAYMHLHIWDANNRRKGIGVELVKKSLPYFFDSLNLERLISEPYALNIAPKRTLEKVGFQFEKEYLTIPGSMNFEQNVNRCLLTRDEYKNTHHNNR
ncbi:MAG: GNAT family N-acetyltransferase [Moraxellaceae bacterium]|nr:MAG: GNAT family N-acetyltransferase [Moraxellaceae bacterium]